MCITIVMIPPKNSITVLACVYSSTQTHVNNENPTLLKLDLKTKKKFHHGIVCAHVNARSCLDLRARRLWLATARRVWMYMYVCV